MMVPVGLNTDSFVVEVFVPPDQLDRVVTIRKFHELSSSIEY